MSALELRPSRHGLHEMFAARLAAAAPARL